MIMKSKLAHSASDETRREPMSNQARLLLLLVVVIAASFTDGLAAFFWYGG
jgi:hypothetical protein